MKKNAKESWKQTALWAVCFIAAAATVAGVVVALQWATAKDSARHFTCRTEGVVLAQASREACQQAWDEGEIALFNPVTSQCCYTGERR